MKISIITATLNSASLIKRMLRSLENQTYTNIEHIVVDGGSTDKTIEVIKDHSFPNRKIVISPNSDGTNDNWHPIYDIDTDIEVIILNRWGEQEFYYSGNSLVFEWDGLSANGNKLSSTDYYYIIKFKDNNFPDRTGVITLIR